MHLRVREQRPSHGVDGASASSADRGHHRQTALGHHERGWVGEAKFSETEGEGVSGGSGSRTGGGATRSAYETRSAHFQRPASREAGQGGREGLNGRGIQRAGAQRILGQRPRRAPFETPLIHCSLQMAHVHVNLEPREFPTHWFDFF
jgi:hypothetical protein